MDKYNETTNTNEITTTRSQKNEQLYQNIYTNRRYTEIGNIEKDNIVDITNTFGKPSKSSRSDFQKSRILYEDGFISDYGEDDIKENTASETEKIKSYNLNEVLEEARKNRSVDVEEKQRKIKNVEYSILSDLSQEKLKDYRERKEKPLSKDEEEDLEDLIHTITSNSLRKKIDDGLLTDLMPETEEEPVISTDFLESLDLAKEQDENTGESEEKEMTLETTIDHSFFTKSMDLSKEDIIPDDEVENMVDESFKEEKMATWKVILIIVLITIVLGLLAYIVLRFV